jgi:hypothetical protein
MKTLIKDLKLVINSTEFKNDEIQIEQLLTDFIKQDRAEQLILSGVVVPKGTLCECGGKERVALDCTMKPCKHPLSFMKNYKTNTNTNR